MMRFVRRLAAMVLLAFASPVPLAAQVLATSLVPDLLQLEPGHSSVLFTSRFLRFVHVAGRFTSYHGAMVYDSLDPGLWSVSAVIDVSSLSTDNELRDRHLKSPDFFDAERYPTIVFRSDRVARTGEGFVAHGTLTMHGVTREVDVPFAQVLPRHVNEVGDVELGFVAQLQLNRRDFGIVGGNQFNPGFNPASALVGDTVAVELNIFAMRFSVTRFPFAARPKPSIGPVLVAAIDSQGVAVAVRRFHDLKAAQPDAFNYGEGQLNLLGYKLLEQGKAADALAIFQLNVEQNPNSGNAYDSLGEGYAATGDRARAIESYRRSLSLDPTNANAMEMLSVLTGR